MLTPEAYSAIPRRALDLADYIDVARRHRGWILGPMFAGIVIATVIAFALPNTYVSQASLRIAPAQISENILPVIVNQQMADRINQMQQDILSRTSLSELIQRPSLDLYKRDRDRKPLDDVIEKMKNKDIKIQMISLPGQQNRVASAFTISYAYVDRVKAKAVVDALVTRFMESNLSGERVAGSMTADFVRDEVKQSKATLDRLNDELTQFRQQNLGRLPEQLQINVQALTALQSQRASFDDALNRDSQEKIILESKYDTLRSQQETFGSLTQQTQDDVQSGKSDSLRDLNKVIADTEVQLAAKKEVYTDAHPDVKSLEATLESLKRQRERAEKDADAQDKQARTAAARSKGSSRGNAYVTAQMNDLQLMVDQTGSQLKALELDRSTKAKQIEQLNREISQFQTRLESGPANEQRYVQLTSDQQQANERYQELLKKQNLADQNQEAQSRKAGEQLEVLDSASLPEVPTAPNRFLIVGIGFGLGAAVGVALTALRELKYTSLKNLKDVRAYTQLPILSSIPLLENDFLVQRRRRVAFVSWSAAFLLGILAVSASMFYHFVLLKS